ncbi:MAG: hypothetical protein ACYTFY_00130 [Planctomycetota bacterium]|jgi:flagellar motility protein MotE (MotC chaperone)
MARKTSIFGFFAMLCAVNFIGLVALVGSMFGFGLISKATFKDMLDIFRGTHLSITKMELNKLLRTQIEAESMKDVLKKEKGKGYIYNLAQRAAEAQKKVTQEEAEIDLERLQLEIEKNTKLRLEIEAVKKDAETAREALAAEKEKQTQYKLAEKTQRLQKTLANMDPADIARDLEEKSKGGFENIEYAAHILSLMKPTQVSEVLTEIKPEVRQSLLPLMENRYANMDPDAVVNEWKNAKPPVSSRQIKEYFRSMPTTQMMKIWRRLDRIHREDVIELMAPMQQGTK